MKILLIIEPSWSIDNYEEEVEIDDGELDGLDESARQKKIADIVQESVNNSCPWGWQEIS